MTIQAFYRIVELMKNQLIEQVAKITSMIGSPARLKILQILAQSPRSVEVIAEITSETIGNTSQHLQKLLSLNLVTVRKEKLTRIYSLTSEKTALIIEELFNLAEVISKDFLKIESEITQSDLIATISLEEIFDEIKKNKAVLIDVREDHESKHTPVPFALTIPIEKIKEASKTMFKSKKYFLFCRGRACSVATDGVKFLRQAGIKAYRIKESPTTLINESKRRMLWQQSK